ncbi:testis-expressed protein 33 isoform X2 [Rhinatrema bivittatum]|uniref:testis-expressed protein 33 isoform X2 n=1 Tax=Rhinatrema bivittatum TaxID=194408 RepID=UPI00112EBFC8|nr:testis-expressed protein 33 isoform X2 [Rhinatrema bivittatum]
MSANPSGANKCGSRLSGNTPDQCQDSMQRKKLTDSHLSRSHREQKTPRNSQCRLSCPSTNRMQTGSPPKGNDPNSMKNGSKQTKQDSEGKPCDLDKPGSSTDRSAAGLQSPTGSCRIEEAQNKVAEETQISSASVSDPGTSNDKLEVSQAQPEAESTERVVVIIPDFRMKEGLMGSSPHACYYELGHCLRANIFPGLWAEKHLEGSDIAKSLQLYLDNLPKFARTWGATSNSVLKVVKVVKPKLPKRSSRKMEGLLQTPVSMSTAKAPSTKCDEHFWDFYDSPLPPV